MNDIKFSNIIEVLGGFWIIKIFFTAFQVFLRINAKIKMVFIFTVVFMVIVVFTTANENNFYFDRHLYNHINNVSKFEKRLLARPILQEVYRDGVVNVEKNFYCPFEPTQIHLDIVSVLIKLSQDYPKLKIITYNYAEFPTTPFRLTGDYFADQIFNNTKQIQCDTARRFKALRMRRWQELQLMAVNKSFQNHSLYREKKCLNCEYFFENSKLHKNQIFGYHVQQNNEQLLNIDTGDVSEVVLAEGKVWVFKYGKFIYIINENNGNQGHYQKIQKGKALIFKKLNINDFAEYDGGSVYKILKFLNISL